MKPPKSSICTDAKKNKKPATGAFSKKHVQCACTHIRIVYPPCFSFDFHHFS